MSCRKISLSLLALFILVLSGCGSSETTGRGPTPTDPNSGPNTPIPSPSPTPDPRIPEWVTRSAPIRLAQSGVYTNLEDLVLQPNESVVLPLVGDPLIAMSLEGGRTNQVKGKLFVALEDKQGFAWREWTSLEAMSQRSSSFLSGYFLDNEMVVKVTGPIVNERFQGTVSFRVRQQGEQQCLPQTVTYYEWVPYCVGQETTYNGQRACYGYWDYYQTTRTETQLDQAACSAYLNSTHPSVKTLGSFEVLLSKWLR